MTIIDLATQLFDERLLSNETQTHVSKSRSPVHVVYGGADLFKAETPRKLGDLALKSIDTYATNFVEFANAMWLKGCDTLPKYDELIADLEFQLADNSQKVKADNFPAWFAWTIYNRTIEKLKREPIEDFRIDFEDGYGIRSDEEEDLHAISASYELAKAIEARANANFCGFRIKSFQPETYLRSVRTLEIFLTNLLKETRNILPKNFVITLPKIRSAEEVKVLHKLLCSFEMHRNLPITSIKIEIMIETPESILIMQDLVKAANGRCVAAHFGAYDYTASFGITAVHQHLKHDACNFARNMMQVSLSPFGIRLSDSVTTEMPVAVHRGGNLSEIQLRENKSTVHKAWRLHFSNVMNSQINGFYQSWDLHPAQLVARYAAVYSFFLESFESQSIRLKGFMEKATKATMSGNQFDDAASAQGLLNYFSRAINCGALTEKEVFDSTGLNFAEIRTLSFEKILATHTI
jgi:hypothetical protein